MPGRGLALYTAVCYALPLILAVEGLVQPLAAWRAVGQSRLLWTAMFLGGPLASLWTGSNWPALVTVLASFFYMAKRRSTLLIAAGIERERRKQPPIDD